MTVKLGSRGRAGFPLLLALHCSSPYPIAPAVHPFAIASSGSYLTARCIVRHNALSRETEVSVLFESIMHNSIWQVRKL